MPLAPGRRRSLDVRARLRHGVESPEQLARAHVIRARVTARSGGWAFLRRGTHNHDIAIDRRRRSDRIRCTRELVSDAGFEIDGAVGAEAGNWNAGPRVEREHPVTRGHVQDALVAAAVGPVRQAASGELARRRLTASAFVLGVHPQHFAGPGVEIDIGALIAELDRLQRKAVGGPREP